MFIRSLFVINNKLTNTAEIFVNIKLLNVLIIYMIFKRKRELFEDRIWKE